MKIRKFRDSDAEGVAEVHRTSVQKIASQDYSEKQVEVWSDTNAEDAILEEDTDKVRYVAVEEGKIIGHTDYKKGTKELSGLYVHADYIGNGVGKRLLRKIEEDAREQGLGRLWCKSTITARDFYKKHGWEELEQTTHEIENQKLKAYKMEKELN